jgi:hypothetical protein
MVLIAKLKINNRVHRTRTKEGGKQTVGADKISEEKGRRRLKASWW